MSEFPNPEAAGLAGFIDASPTPWHAAEMAGRLLSSEASFVRHEPSSSPLDSERGCVVRGGSLIAWSWATDAVAESADKRGIRLIGAHSDSPNLRIRPRPDSGAVGVKQLGVEVYGGALVNSWLDLDLTLAGRVQLTDGSTAIFSHNRALLRVPQLAIHLDRDITAEGLKLNKQTHLNPIWGLGAPVEGEFRDWLAAQVGCSTSDVLDWDVACADTRPSTSFGQQQEFLAAPRLDNLCSAYGALRALQSTTPADGPNIVVLHDHEEVGSTTATGAASAWLTQILERLALARGIDRAGFLELLVRSTLLSADMAHATHPNYPDRHEPSHHIDLGAGPVIKHNVNARYATDSEGAAKFRQACAAAGVGVQDYSHRGDLACGSTIGPVAAAELGVETVDVGMAQLSMHSAREMMANADVPAMVASFSAWFRPSGRIANS